MIFDFKNEDNFQQFSKDLIEFFKNNDIYFQVHNNVISSDLKVNNEIIQKYNLESFVVYSDANYYFVSRNYQQNNSDFWPLNKNELLIIAGPCAIENIEQMKQTTLFLQEQKVNFVRGGVFKPRTSPYGFQGLGEKGLEIFHQLKTDNQYLVSEIMSVEQLKYVAQFDIVQIGARNMQNYELLKAVSLIDKPIILKRGLSATIDELLSAAEYIYVNGNQKIILCERGIRTFETKYRNTIDINAIVKLKQMTHLPVIADPSHGTGDRTMIEKVSLASIAAGADGVLIEIHPNPNQAISDADQTIDFLTFQKLNLSLRRTFEFFKN